MIQNNECFFFSCLILHIFFSRLLLNFVTGLQVGDMVGGIVFENNSTYCDFYYFTESACQLVIFTQAKFEQLRIDNLEIYMKIIENFNQTKISYENIYRGMRDINLQEG